MNWNDTLFKIEDNNISAFAQRWNAEEDSLSLISKGINIVYKFKANNTNQYLRITHQNIRNYSALESALQYQDHLFQNAVSVCAPLKSTNGHFIESIKQNEHVFFASAVNEAKGLPIDLKLTSKELLFQWGKELAKLHSAALAFKPNSNNKYLSVFDLLKETEEFLANEDEKTQHIFNDIKTWLSSLDNNMQNFALTHGDHREANVLWDGKQITFIDFDEPVNNWFLSDIVRPFITLFECNKKIPEELIFFLKGYKTIHFIDNISDTNLSYFARMKALEMYLWTKNIWKSETIPGGEPQEIWLESLRRIIF